jgi:hypothetical protein
MVSASMASSRRFDPAGRTLLRRRLASQHLATPYPGSPVDLVRAMGAVQAQDYPGGLWGIGLRLDGASEAAVERAIADATLVRTWPMRRTLHLVAGEDVRWMLRLLAPRQLALSAGRHRQLGLADGDFARAGRILERALRGGRRLTRGAAYEELRRGGVAPDGQRGIHVVADLAQQGLLCFGPREGKQPTLVLLEEWVAPAAEPSRDESLATLAARYFGGHGPATLRDFVWWSGLTTVDARAGIEMAGDDLGREVIGGSVCWLPPSARPGSPQAGAAHLLPAYDEYLVAYKDRTAAVDPRYSTRGANVILGPTILVNGRVVGTWKPTQPGKDVVVTLKPFGPLRGGAQEAVIDAARRYGAFLGRAVRVELKNQPGLASARASYGSAGARAANAAKNR